MLNESLCAMAINKPSLAAIHARHPLRKAVAVWADENVEQALIHQAVMPGDRVLELGTNAGRATIVAAECAGPTGRVVSAEADPLKRKAAMAHAKRLTNIDFVSALSESASARVALTRSGFIRGSPHLADRATSSSSIGGVATTPMARLQPPYFDVFVIDCEGCLDGLLPGLISHGLINRTRTIVLENDAVDAKAQANTHASLGRLGFRPTVCIAHPALAWSEELRARCFFSVLQRTSSTRPIVTVTHAAGSDPPRMSRREVDRYTKRAVEETRCAVLPR